MKPYKVVNLNKEGVDVVLLALEFDFLIYVVNDVKELNTPAHSSVLNYAAFVSTIELMGERISDLWGFDFDWYVRVQNIDPAIRDGLDKKARVVCNTKVLSPELEYDVVEEKINWVLAPFANSYKNSFSNS